MSDSKECKLEVGYWKIRGLAGALRMICEYTKTDYKNSMYPVTGEPGKWDLTSWFGVKPALQEKNPLMNLPYIVDGDVVVTQSNSCLSYLGRKFNLNGANDTEVTRCEQMLCQIMDLRNDSVRLFYNKAAYDEGAEKWVTTGIHGHLGKLNNFMKLNKTAFAAGDKPTVADFHLFEIIDHNCELAKFWKKENPLDKHAELKAFHAAFKALPELAGYFKSDNYNLPINNTMATFGAAARQADGSYC